MKLVLTAMLYESVGIKRDLSVKVKLSIYPLIFFNPHLLSHVGTERMGSYIQGAEMSFLQKVSGLSLRDRERSFNS